MCMCMQSRQIAPLSGADNDWKIAFNNCNPGKALLSTVVRRLFAKRGRNAWDWESSKRASIFNIYVIVGMKKMTKYH